MEEYENKIVYSPSPGTYVVLRLNPVETVRHLDDPIALAEAQAMRTKSHLVILDMELALPFPNRPWYRFDVQSIAPCLRDEEPQKGLTSDMCIPIFPNVDHPNGRAPVYPEPESLFPYSNCYHWYKPVETTVRIRARPEEFDETNAASLSPLTLARMMFTSWREDGRKMGANLIAMKAAAATSPAQTAPRPTTPSRSTPSAAAGIAQDCKPQRVLHTVPVAERPDDDSTSTYAGSDSTRTVDSDNYSDYSDDILGPIDPFSAPDEDVELVPLVDVWVSELAEHLKQEDIPHPSELVAEVEQLTGIVQRARVRAYAALTALPPATPSVSQSMKPKRFRPAKAWTKVWSGARRVVVWLRSRLHAPSSQLCP